MEYGVCYLYHSFLSMCFVLLYVVVLENVGLTPP